MSSIRVPSGLYYQARFFAATSGLWRRLSALESLAVRTETAPLDIVHPLYIAGLPRSGTTIVTEMLARHPHLTCHRYSDFPNIWTPYWRNHLLAKSRFKTPEVKERAHGDRILVNNDSPEAVEEVLWMYFFPGQHDPASSQVLDGRSRNEEFDGFYRQHILKLLAVRKAKRYLSKGNYNIARIRYILSLFPDAKFLIPVRDPLDHVASLMRQHALFSGAANDDPRVPLQLAMSGHFEFGPRRVAVNFGDPEATGPITDCWRQGHEIEGWARYWAEIYRYVIGEFEAFPEVRKACLLFRYEDLCAHSASVIDAILAHCELPQKGFEPAREEYISRLTAPDYYTADFTAHERGLIAGHCGAVNEKLSKFCQNP
ncbi:MAG: sulfotransferase [Lysobacterales bacterium]